MATPPGIERNAKRKINAETAVIGWHELLRFFAAGQCVYVAPELDLVAVARHIAEDDTRQVNTWMQQGLVGQVSDQQAAQWLDEQALVWSVVVKPWVLVQPKVVTP